MRLLWMKSDYVVPADTGGRIRTYNLLRELNQLCDVTYLSFKSERTPNTEPGIRQCAREVVTCYRPEESKSGLGFHARVLCGLPSRLPYAMQRLRSRELRGFLSRFAGNNGSRRDAVILCDFLQMAENVEWSLPCPKILFQHNVEHIIWRRYVETETNRLKRAYFRLEHQRMRRYEREACNRFDLVFAVSEKDKQVLQDELHVTTPIEVIETGVDTEFFAPRPKVRPRAGELLFLGSLDWMPNVDGAAWFVAEVYPSIKATHPEVTLQLVGRRPGEAIRRLAEKDPSIAIQADVPDVRPFIAQADLVIVPLRVGGGTRIKIYEAMAMARPVVATVVGAEGLPVRDGEHIALADSAQEFAAQVNTLLENPARKHGLARAGFQLVSEKYQWKSIAKRFHDLCQARCRS